MEVDMTGPSDYDAYWGDFHKHASEPVSNLDRLDEALVDARYNVDIYPVLCYPFIWTATGDIGFEYRTEDRTHWGIREETVGNRPEFHDWWHEIQAATAEHNDPGRFVTFPAYEWNGNRRRWGDHNVIHFEEGGPLDDARDLADLYENLHSLDMPALALPHHTAYKQGERAKDWDVFDSDLSPVMEVYSAHGSSEGVGTPVPMDSNPSMGPRTSGGTLQDGLARGHRVGVIASNDSGGLPGSWDDGVAGVWATDLTREGVWEALESRRTYGTTGDRIELWYELDDCPMGSVADPDGSATATVEVDCARPLDRVELVGDGRVVDTYSHHGTWAYPDPGEEREFSVLVEMGWGPKPSYGDWHGTENEWVGTARVAGGRLEDVQPRFNGWGQRFERDGDACSFDLTTERGSATYEPTQGLVFTVVGDGETTLEVDVEDHDPLSVALGDLSGETRVVAFTEACYERVESEFGLARADIDNSDLVYHNARKLKIHPAHPRAACATTVEFDNLPTDCDYYYVRASQTDGQYAWSSPVWLDSETDG
jgi:hypothetical protein